MPWPIPCSVWESFFVFYTQSTGTFFSGTLPGFLACQCLVCFQYRGSLILSSPSLPPHRRAKSKMWISSGVHHWVGNRQSHMYTSVLISLLKDTPSIPRQSTGRWLHDWHCVLYTRLPEEIPFLVKLRCDPCLGNITLFSPCRRYTCMITGSFCQSIANNTESYTTL